MSVLDLSRLRMFRLSYIVSPSLKQTTDCTGVQEVHLYERVKQN